MKLKMSRRDIPQHLQKFFRSVGYKPKDLVNIPNLVAEALREDGWWLRSDIIWHKPNPMPESVTDRPTKSHEYIFLLTKSAKYYYDAEAIKEPQAAGTFERYGNNGKIPTRQKLGGSSRSNESFLSSTPNAILPNGRNRRTVWTIPTAPFKGAHFATFPPKLVEPCILAGTSEKGCCPKCGSPWERIVERNNPSKQANTGPDERYGTLDNMGGNYQTVAGLHRNGSGVYSSAKTTGWRPTCKCNIPETVPCAVLDPFGGSGTVGAVAKEKGRDYLLIELNPAYVQMAQERIDAVTAPSSIPGPKKVRTKPRRGTEYLKGEEYVQGSLLQGEQICPTGIRNT